MRVRQDLAHKVEKAVETAQSAGDLPQFEIPKVTIEKPRDEGFGDYACPIAMQLARPARMAPLKIAERIAAHVLRINTSMTPSWLNAYIGGAKTGDLWLGSVVIAQMLHLS